MEKHERIKQILNNVHWTTSEEMIFSSENKYELELPEKFTFGQKYYSFTPAQSLTPNYHDFYEIVYSYRGESIFFIENRKYLIKEGDVMLIRPGQMHNVVASSSLSTQIISIYFSPDFIYHPGGNDFDFNYLLPFYFCDTELSEKLPSNLFKDHSILNIILEIETELAANKKYYRLAIKTLVSELLLLILRSMNSNNAKPKGKIKTHQKIERLKDVFQFTHDNYSKEIKEIEVAEKACMSTNYFCKYYKQVTGLTLVEYVKRYRIDKAKDLLLKSESPISSIAFAVGFNSQSYFNRVFMHYTKLSPKKFRNNFRNSSNII